MPLLVPMIATPLLLRVLPTHFLPILVGDYIAAHFALYGLITAACLLWLGAPRPRPAPRPAPFSARRRPPDRLRLRRPRLADQRLRHVLPAGAGTRVLLILAMLVGTLAYFLADEWLTRGPGAARGGYAASKLAFVVSLAIAVSLDFERLFFLIIIVPVIVLFFLVYGLFSAWIYRSTGHPLVAAIANAVAFAWAIGVTFPLLGGSGSIPAATRLAGGGFAGEPARRQVPPVSGSGGGALGASAAGVDVVARECRRSAVFTNSR